MSQSQSENEMKLCDWFIRFSLGIPRTPIRSKVALEDTHAIGGGTLGVLFGHSCENGHGHILTFKCPCATIIGGSHGSGSMWRVSVNLELANSSCSLSNKRVAPRLR